MAADKEIMKALETLRLDRPGRTYAAGDVAVEQNLDFGFGLVAALHELAATFREEAGLWAKSGARGWKSSETEAFLIAQAIDDVAAQLDNAGGGAALSVSVPGPFVRGSDDHVEAELRESAQRVDGVRDLAALDQLIKDTAAERKGMVRDELLPEGHPAAERKTAYDWNADPRIDPVVVSWSDFGSSAHQQNIEISPNQLITRAVFEQIRDGGAVTVGPRRSRLPMAPGTRVEIGDDDVTAYLKGETNDIPGSAPLTPNSITSAPEAGDPFASAEDIADAGLVLDPNGSEHGPDDRNYSRVDVGMPPRVPGDWSSETMTADGHLLPGVAKAAAPLLGQPGDAGTGYSHAYIPAGGRRVTYAELLTPVPAASLPAHLSHSQGNTIGDCGVKYRLQRVEGLPQVPQWANVGGSAFHAAVEAFERTVAGMPEVFEAEGWQGYDCETVWKHHFEGQINAVSASSPVPVSVWRAARKGAEGRQWWEVNGPLMLRRYLDARPNRNPITIDSTGTPAIEWEVTADVPTGYGPVPFVAKLDSVKLSADGTAVVIEDYKTSYERPTDTTQLGEYAQVLLLSGANLHGASRILGTYFDARRGEWTTPVDLLAEHPFEAFQYRVTTAYAQRRALTTGPTPVRPSSYCGGCSVRYACPIMAAKS